MMGRRKLGIGKGRKCKMRRTRPIEKQRALDKRSKVMKMMKMIITKRDSFVLQCEMNRGS